MPGLPEELNSMGIEAGLWLGHFMARLDAENKYFGKQNFLESAFTNYIMVENQSQLNNRKQVLGFIKEINPDIALIFGCGMIKGELAQALPELTINLHLGLSPRYRGAATLFWPFYFLEPQWAGCTFHKIVDEPDAGDILHQCVPELAKGDGVHDVAAKAVVKATDDMIKLLGMWDAEKISYRYTYSISPTGKTVTTEPEEINESWKFHPQTTTGKNFLARDFQPSHPRMIYETYNNDIVDQYLDGNLKQHKPRLVRQW